MFYKLFSTVKYSLVTVNFLFLIIGIIVLAVGSNVQKAYNDYQEFLSGGYQTLPGFCIATGIIILIIAALGFYGAYRVNYITTIVYVVCMIVMFVFVMSACIAGYVLKGNTMAILQKDLLDTMKLYGVNANLVITKLWDEVQQDFSCCGVNNPADWVSALNTTGELPISCCAFPYGEIHTFNCTTAPTPASNDTLTNSDTLFTTGCATAFGNWVKSHIASIALAGVFLIILQGLVVGGAIWLAKMMRDEQE